MIASIFGCLIVAPIVAVELRIQFWLPELCSVKLTGTRRLVGRIIQRKALPLPLLLLFKRSVPQRQSFLDSL